MSIKHSQYISTAELAQFLGISQVAVFKRIKSGKIKAEKIGRSYAISRAYIESDFKQPSKTILAPSQYISTVAAAKLLGITRMAVVQRIQRGELPAKKVGRHYVIDKSLLIIPSQQKAEQRENLLKKEYLSVMECAVVMGIGRNTVLRRISQGVIPAKKVGRHYVVACDCLGIAGEQGQKGEGSVEDYYSVIEVARLLGMSRIAVFKRIRKGQLKAVKMGRSYSVPKWEIETKINE